MKKNKILILIIMVLSIMTVVGLAGCDKPPKQLSKPTGIEVNEVEKIVKWEPVEGAKRYSVQVDSNLLVDNGLETSYSYSYLTAAGNYKIRIMAIGDGKKFTDSDWTEYKDFKIEIKLDKLSAPIGLTISESEKKISWSSVKNAVSYSVQVDSELAVNVGSETVFSLASMTEKRSYKIKVKAHADGINFSDSSWSAERTYTPPAPSKLSTPAGLNITAKKLSWESVTGAFAYHVRVNGGNPINNDTNTEFSLDSYSYGIYKLQVLAKGDGTISADSNWSAEIKYVYNSTSATKLATPSGISIDYSGKILSWDVVPNSIGYTVRLNNTTEYDVSSANFSLASFILAGTYTFEVKALGNALQYSDSNWAQSISYVIEQSQGEILEIMQVQMQLAGCLVGEIVTDYFPTIIKGTKSFSFELKDADGSGFIVQCDTQDKAIQLFNSSLGNVLKIYVYGDIVIMFTNLVSQTTQEYLLGALGFASGDADFSN